MKPVTERTMEEAEKNEVDAFAQMSLNIEFEKPVSFDVPILAQVRDAIHNSEVHKINVTVWPEDDN